VSKMRRQAAIGLRMPVIKDCVGQGIAVNVGRYAGFSARDLPCLHKAAPNVYMPRCGHQCEQAPEFQAYGLVLLMKLA